MVTNGSYGLRQVDILKKQRKHYIHLAYNDDETIRPAEVIAALDKDPSITHLSLVHSETTSGVIN